MSYFFDICDKTIQLKSKNNRFIYLSHKEFDRCKHITLTIKNPDTNEIDNTIYKFIIQFNKKYDYYLIKYDFKLVFNGPEYSPHIKTESSNNEKMISWKSFLEEVIKYFNIKGYTLDRIDKLNNITIADKMDMS